MKSELMAELERHPFHPPWWLVNRHAQTMWSPLFRRQPPVDARLQPIDTPDGDRLDLYVRPGRPDRPTALLLHGLEGSVRSNYIAGLQHALGAHGWTAVAMEFRSCGGRMNRARRLYHSGETTDLDFVVRDLIDRDPGIGIYIAGFSLGGNVVAKWLGEQGETAPEPVKAAAVVSPPFDLAASAPYFERSLFGLYQKRFLRTLIPKAQEKERQYPGCLDMEAVRRSRTFRDFDTHATAALHGFEDAEDYWARSSCGTFLGRIRRPTLLVAAADDPFNPPETLPHAVAAESPYLYPLFPARGGHVGFVSGSVPGRLRRWAEDQIVRFFLACSARDPSAPASRPEYSDPPGRPL